MTDNKDPAPQQDSEAERIRQNNRRMIGRAFSIVGIGWAMFAIAAYYGMVIKGKKEEQNNPPAPPAAEEAAPVRVIENKAPVIKAPAP